MNMEGDLQIALVILVFGLVVGFIVGTMVGDNSCQDTAAMSLCLMVDSSMS